MIMFHGLFASTDLLIWEVQIFFLPIRLASLRSRNRKAYAVVCNCPYIRAPVGCTITKSVSLPVMPSSRPDHRYARRVDRQIYVRITYTFIRTSSETMLAFISAWDGGIVPTRGGSSSLRHCESNGVVKFMTLLVARRDSAHTSLKVSYCIVTDPQQTKTRSKTSGHSIKLRTHLFWELAGQVTRELAHAGFTEAVGGLCVRQPS